MNVQNYFTDFRKCGIGYLAFVMIFVFVMFTGENFKYWQNEVVLIALVSVLGLTTLYYSFKNKQNLHKVALVIIIVFGMLMLIFTPPMSFPDEGIHFTRAELITEGVLLPEVTDRGVYVNDYYFNLNHAYTGTTILTDDSFNTPITEHKGYWEDTTESPFYAYLFSAVGIFIAKLLNLTALWALYLARMANLIVYAFVSYSIIKKVPKFKFPMLVIATIPLCISQVSSTSYDAFILTFSLVILGYFIKMYCGELNKKNMVIFFTSVLLISLIKPPYIILAFLILAIPNNQYRKYGLIAIPLVFILTLLGYSYIFTQILTTPIGTADVSFQGQLNFVLSNPLVIFTLLKNIIVSIPTVFILKSNFFHYTGFKGIKFINILYLLFFLGFSLFYKLDIKMDKKERGILALIFAVVYLGVNAISYLQWNRVGSHVILGVQSRYFLPVIALLPLIINTGHFEIENKEKYIFTFIIIILTGMFMLPVTHYY